MAEPDCAISAEIIDLFGFVLPNCPPLDLKGRACSNDNAFCQKLVMGADNMTDRLGSIALSKQFF
jgi:hypothetical protein